MRRWNGWGDELVTYTLHDGPRRYLEAKIGPGTRPQDAAFEELVAGVPATRLPTHPLVSEDAPDRVRHARGQSLPDWIALRTGCLDAFPDGVAYPASGEEVRELLGYARRVGARLVPYGGGTSVVGHINPLPGDAPVLTLDLSRMNRLYHWDDMSLLATFGAGVAGPDLEAQLRARGCTLGHFPQSFELSTLGGWIVTRSSGQQSLGYGRIERLFAGGCLETPVGTLELPPFPSSAAGPDLREVVLGSEGRLGVLTEATVRATRLPEVEAFHAVFFPDMDRGREAVREIMQARLPLSMVRLSTPMETQTTLALAGHEQLIGAMERLLSLRRAGADKVMLLLGFTGREALVKMARSEALGIAGSHGGVHVGRTFGKQWHKTRFHTPYLRNTLWEMGYAVDTLETALGWADLPALIDDVEAALHSGLEPAGERVHVFTHLSHLYPYGSSIYTTYLFRLAATGDRREDARENLRRWQVLKGAASEAILARGGTITHQHGIGTDHLPYMGREKGAMGSRILTGLCQAFDPAGIMNPGKLIEEGNNVG